MHSRTLCGMSLPKADCFLGALSALVTISSSSTREMESMRAWTSVTAYQASITAMP